MQVQRRPKPGKTKKGGRRRRGRRRGRRGGRRTGVKRPRRRWRRWRWKREVEQVTPERIYESLNPRNNKRRANHENKTTQSRRRRRRTERLRRQKGAQGTNVNRKKPHAQINKREHTIALVPLAISVISDLEECYYNNKIGIVNNGSIVNIDAIHTNRHFNHNHVQHGKTFCDHDNKNDCIGVKKVDFTIERGRGHVRHFEDHRAVKMKVSAKASDQAEEGAGRSKGKHGVTYPADSQGDGPKGKKLPAIGIRLQLKEQERDEQEEAKTKAKQNKKGIPKLPRREREKQALQKPSKIVQDTRKQEIEAVEDRCTTPFTRTMAPP